MDNVALASPQVSTAWVLDLCEELADLTADEVNPCEECLAVNDAPMGSDGILVRAVETHNGVDTNAEKFGTADLSSFF